MPSFRQAHRNRTSGLRMAPPGIGKRKATTEELSNATAWEPNCRGRDDHRWPPPAQIRTCAFTHTAPTEDEWRRSAYRDKDAEHEVAESTGAAVG